jgi:alanine-synthesizing transaminase
MSTNSPKPLAIRERLSEVRYEIRGELARRARELEAQGRKLIKLNIGNPGLRFPRARAPAARDRRRHGPHRPVHPPAGPAGRTRSHRGYYARRGAPMRTRTACSSATASAN